MVIEDVVGDIDLRNDLGSLASNARVVCRFEEEEEPTFIVVGTTMTESGDFCFIVEHLGRS